MLCAWFCKASLANVDLCRWAWEMQSNIWRIRSRTFHPHSVLNRLLCNFDALRLSYPLLSKVLVSKLVLVVVSWFKMSLQAAGVWPIPFIYFSFIWCSFVLCKCCSLFRIDSQHWFWCTRSSVKHHGGWKYRWASGQLHIPRQHSVLQRRQSS